MLRCSDLVRVWIEHDVGISVRAHCQKAHGLLAAIDELMGAVLTTWKVDDLAFGEYSPAVWCAESRSARQDDHHLLLGEVVVIRVGGLTCRQLPQAGANSHTAQLVAESRPPSAKSLVLAWLVE